jgi:hypothetical protein
MIDLLKAHTILDFILVLRDVLSVAAEFMVG